MFRFFKRRAQHESPPMPSEVKDEQELPQTMPPGRSNEESRALYSNVGLHDATRSGWFNSKTRELFTGFNIDSDHTLVDVGCGAGGNLKFCAPLAKRVIGIDIDAAKIEIASQTIAASGTDNATFIVSDASPIPLENSIADRIVCTEVLEHVEDPTKTMAELWRIGKPGALYLISVPGQLSEELLKPIAPAFWFEHPNHIRIFDKDGFEKLVNDSNLIIERQEFVSFYWAVWHTLLCLCNVEHHTGTHPALDLWSEAWDAVLADKTSKDRIHLLDRTLHKSHIIIARKPDN